MQWIVSGCGLMEVAHPRLIPRDFLILFLSSRAVGTFFMRTVRSNTVQCQSNQDKLTNKLINLAQCCPNSFHALKQVDNHLMVWGR